MKLEGNKLPKAKAEATWEQRLAMVSSNDSEEEQEAFVISKYDLLPESLTDRVQVSQPPSHLHGVGFWSNPSNDVGNQSDAHGRLRSYSIGCRNIRLHVATEKRSPRSCTSLN